MQNIDKLINEIKNRKLQRGVGSLKDTSKLKMASALTSALQIEKATQLARSAQFKSPSLEKAIQKASNLMQELDVSIKMADTAVLDPSAVWFNKADYESMREYVLRRYDREMRDVFDPANKELSDSRAQRPADYILYEKYVVLSLYTYEPPMRANYSPLRVTMDRDEYNRLSDPESKDQSLLSDSTGRKINVMLLWKSGQGGSVKRATLLSRDSKTSMNRTSGQIDQVTFEMSEEMAKILWVWKTKYNTGPYLFSKVKTPNTALSNSEFSTLVSNTVFAAAGAKSAGIDLMRHSYCSWLFDESPGGAGVARGTTAHRDLVSAANMRMGHNTEMALKYVRYFANADGCSVNANQFSRYEAPDMDASGNLVAPRAVAKPPKPAKKPAKPGKTGHGKGASLSNMNVSQLTDFGKRPTPDLSEEY